MKLIHKGCVLLAVAAITLALPPATAYAAPNDSVTGGARDFTGANVSISAKSGPSAVGASGHINATLPNPRNPAGGTLQFRLEVTCLVVSGNLASIGAVATEAASNDVPTGFPFVITIKDSGIPGGEGDRLGLFAGPDALPCPDLLDEAKTSPPISLGNLHVRDNA